MDEEAESPAEQAISAMLSERYEESFLGDAAGRIIVMLSVISFGFRRIDIVLDQPQQVYYSGQQISGRVHLDVSETVDILGKFVGNSGKLGGMVWWEE